LAGEISKGGSKILTTLVASRNRLAPDKTMHVAPNGLQGLQGVLLKSKLENDTFPRSSRRSEVVFPMDLCGVPMGKTFPKGHARDQRKVWSTSVTWWKVIEWSALRRGTASEVEKAVKSWHRNLRYSLNGRVCSWEFRRFRPDPSVLFQ